ncbi:uncharacterized protein LOC132551915 [Ylistrum balloti]|uniref:uncharacterized protein LOC132551915 n=1 Tax=Ylistrum balloti TaxID=509963 RepID=UPI002905AFA2|nr:uncharacterized protein LOC132551915 [Ylistrum balloti]
MGVLRQLKELLWKNIILRRREPHILLLEILWPLIIFGIVAVIRHGTPGDKKSTCSYADRAMPSAGMLPFMQSTVCSLKNPCEAEETVQQRQTSASKLTSLVSDLQPYLTANASVQALQTLESSVKVVKGLNELLSPRNSSDGKIQQGLVTALGNDTFTVKNLLKDTAKVKRVLVEELKIMTPEVADAFLNANVDVVKVFQSIGGIDLRYIVCNVDELKKYMIFDKSVNVDQISEELCAIDTEKIPAITDMVQSQLDIAAIIRSAKALTSLTQTYELGDAMEDIASMVDVLSGTSSLGSMFSSMSMLQELPSLMTKLPGLVTQVQSFEASSIDELLMFLDPIIRNFAPNFTDWQTIMNLADQIKSAAGAIGSDGNLNVTALLGNGLGNLSSITNMLDIDPEVAALFQTSGQSANDISASIQAAMEGQPMDQRSLAQQLDSLHMTIEMFVGKDSLDQMLCSADSVMDMLTTMVQYAEDIKKETDLTFGLFMVNMNSLLRNSQVDSTDTYVIMNAIFRPQVLTAMLRAPENFSAVCEHALGELMADMDPQKLANTKALMCATNFSPLFQTMRDTINVTSIENEMADAFKKLGMSLEGYNCTGDARLTMEELYPVAMNLSTRLSNLATPTYIWEQYGVEMVMDFPEQNWMWIQEVITQTILNNTWSNMVTMMGPMMEDTPLWSMMGPMLYNVYTQMDSTIQQVEFMEKMMDPSSDTGKLMKYVINYMPEIMTTMMNPNSSQMLTEVMSSPDPVQTMCDQHTLQKMGMPDSVPVMDMEIALCNINWTEVVVGMTASYDVEAMMQQVAMYFEPNSTVRVPDKFDWDGMVSNMEQMQQLYSGESAVADMIMTINFTRLEQAMSTMLMSSLPDMTRISTMMESASMNMTWEELISTITGMGNLNGGLQQSDMINMLLDMLLPGNSSTVMQEIRAMEAVYTNQLHTSLQFIIKHLTYFNKADSVDLRAYLGSAELNKILDNVAAGPDVNSVVLETLRAMMTDTNLVNYLMNNLDQLCTNRSIFEGIFKVPPGNNIDLGQMYSSICGLDINITKMFEEIIQNVDGLSDVFAIYMSPPPGLVSVNYSIIMADQDTVNSLMESLIMHPPVITIGGNVNWMNITLYIGQLESFMGELSSAFTMDNLAQLQEPGLDSAFSSLQSIPEMESMLQMISFYVKTAKERLTQSIDASEDPLAALKGFPTLQKLMELADDIPHLYAVLVFNSIYHSKQVNNVLMVESWEGFCVLSDLPLDVPGSTFSMSDFHTELCSLNLTALETEAAAYQAISFGLLNYTVDVTSTVVNITQLSEQVSEIFNLLITIENSTTEEEMILPNFLNWTVWEQVNSHLFSVIADPDRLMNLVTSTSQNTGELLNPWMAVEPAIQEQLRIQSIVYGIIGVFMDKLDNLSNITNIVFTVINFDEILANDPETLKLWTILKTPGVLEILVSSANSPQFTQLLLMENETEALQVICDSNTNLTSFLNVPGGVQVDLGQLQADFCQVRFDLLEQEFLEEIMMVISKYMDNSTELNWSNVTSQYIRMSQWIEIWSVNAPTLDLPSLANLQAMLEQQYGQGLVDWSWTTMFGQTMGPITDPDLEKAIATVNLILEVVNNRLDHLTDTVSLTTLLRNDTDVEQVLQAYLNIVQYSTDLLSPDSDINVERLLQLIENGSVLMSMCQSSSLATYLSKSGQATNLTINIQTAMCMNPEVFLQNLQSQAEADYIATQLMRIWNSSEPLNVNWNDLNNNVENMTRLLTTLLEQEPMVDMGAWNLFGNFSTLMQSFDSLLQDPFKLLEMSASVNPLMATEVDPELGPFLDVWQQVYSNVHLMISSVKDGKPINSSLLLSLFNAMSSLDIQQSLMGESNYMQMLEDIGQHTDVQGFVCDVAALDHHFPDADTISSALCGKPANTWFSILQQTFGMNSTIPSHLVEVLKTVFPQHFMTSTGMTWGELFNQIQNFTETTMTLDATHTEMLMQAILGALGDMTQSDQTIGSSLEWLKMIDENPATSAQGLLTFLMEINKYLNRQMQLLQGSGNNIPLSVLLPNSTLLADLLEQLNHETAAGLLTAYINPEEFLELTLTDRWTQVVCNASLFQQTFTFPDGTNTQMIQQDLCTDAQSHQSVVTEILQSLNVVDVLTAFDDWIMGRTPAVPMNDTYVWQALQHNIEILLVNMEKITNVTLSTSGLEQWFSPIMKAFDTLSRPNPESIGQTCEMMLSYVDNTDLYTSSIQPIMLGVLNNMAMTTTQMAIQSIVEDSLCDLASWNISALTKRIQDTNLTQLIISLGSPVTDVSGTFQCSAMVAASNDLAKMWNESVARMTASSSSYDCLVGSLQAPLNFFSDASQTFSLVSDLFGVLMDPAILSLDDTGSLLPLVEFMYNVFMQQQNVSVKLVDVLTNAGSFEEGLSNVLQISPEVLAQLLNSTLNIDGLSMLDQSATDIAKTLCDPDKLSEVISLPQFSNVSIEELSKLLCGPNITSTVEVFTSLLDFSTISFILSDSNTDLSMWSVLSAHIAEVISNVQQLTNLPTINIDFNNLNTLLPYLQRFIFDYGPEALVDSLNVLVEDFKSLTDDEMAVALMADAQLIMTGMTSLKVIRNFIPLNVVLQQVLKDSNSTKHYMISELGLSPEVAEAVLSGAIDYSVLLRYDYKDLEKHVCDPMLLSGLLNLTASTSIQVSQISTALCNLSDAQTVNLTESLLQNLDVGELVEEYVKSGVNELLNSFNVTPAEVSDSLTKLSAAEEELTAAATIYKNGSADLNLNILASPEALTGSSLPSVSNLLCGDNSDSLSITDSSGISGKVGSSKELTADQHKEKEELGEGFCKDLYVDIITSEYGPVVWTYLKPLIRGKILYSPNTLTTQELASMMYNSSFGILEDVQYYSRLWAKGLTDLNELKSDPNLMDNINGMTSNTLVQSVLQSLTGMSTDNLVSGLSLLDTFNQDDLTSMEYLANMLINYTSCLEINRFKGYDTEAQVMQAAYEYGSTNNLLAVVVFDNLEVSNRKKRGATNQLPKHVSYKIRMDLENVRNTVRLKERMWRPYPEDDMVFDMRYTRGFIQLQDMVDTAIIRMQTGESPNDPVIHTKQFPSPCHVNDMYMNALSMYLLPVMMTLAWVAALAVATKNLVYDRQDGQEEALKVMGLHGSLNWCMWFLSALVIMSFTSVICILILKAGDLYAYSSFAILFLYFCIFCFSSLMLCYMISALFTQATLAVLTVLMVYAASYIPYMVLIAMEVQMKFWQKILACLASTTSFGFAAQYIARYEIQMVGMHWDKIYESPMPGDEMSFAWCCLMMIIDGVIYLIIGWYLRSIRPGKHGISLPWYFPVSPSYWGCKFISSNAKYRAYQQELVEEMPTNMTVGMSVQGLCKSYGKTKAVKDLTADFYAGQITVLLGHNGAAKTTTIKMMTGVLEPTKGEIYLHGQPLYKCSKKIGICAQHETLFHYMTVEEHMEFYGSVKSSMSSKELKYEREQLLKQVDMWHVRMVRVSDLSGGMRRRLCVALAFVGGSEVVILDEPTSGVDPNGRHSIWNLLLQRKSGCTILLSTHHLDEADMIADRIAVMDNGRLMCVGSPLFLKQRLGSGYHLKLTKLDECNWVHVLDCIRTYIPEAAVVEDIGSEMTIKLPVHAGNMERLYSALHNLDKYKDSLNIGSYGIFDTTLEEVFLKICAVAEKNIPLTDEVVQKASEMQFDNRQQRMSKSRDLHAAPQKHSKRARVRVSEGSQKWQQFGALLTKRFHHYRRNWRMFLSVILFPVLFVAAALGLTLIKPDEIESPSLLLTPALYGPNSYGFYSDSVQTAQSQKISHHLWSNPGMSTTCMPGVDYGSPFVCEAGQTVFSSNVSNQATYDAAQCTCSDYRYTCNSHAHSITVPQVVTNTTDIIQNLGTHNVTDYLLKTYEAHKENRFGGISFETTSDSTSNMKATVWFNNRGHHALPGYLNALSNSILRSKITQGDPAEYGITAYNHPILLTKQQLSQESILQNAADIGIAMVFLLAFTAIPVGFVSYVVSEHSKKEKQLQHVSGVGNFLYWFTSLLWDMAVFCLTVGLVVVVMAIFRQNSYWARENLAGVVVLLLLYGWATLPWMYCTVKLFKETTSAYMVLFCLNLFIGVLLVSLVFVLNFFSSQEGIKNVYDIVRRVFLIFPPYVLCDGLIELTSNQVQAEILARFKQDTYVSPFSYDMLAYNYIALAIAGFAFFILLFFTEIRCPSRARVKKSIDDEIEESNEVRNEKQRVLSHQARNDALVVSSLSKAYKRGRKSFLAVNHLSFGVPKGECFGLLGANGAGKTTTFRMLTGDVLPSEGSATVNHNRVTRANPAIGQEVGYCPQEDALDGYLTGRELLHCHAKLRGMPSDHRDSIVEDLVIRLGLDFADRTVHTYSGGMKRKLSIAIALLGDPQVVFLDEPTTGMDPVAKRLVWNCLMTCVKNQQAVVLTSHSMEECDAMCTRLAIMVNGEFRCLGSPQVLKNKYGDGYTVTLFTNGLSTNMMALSTFTQSSFPGSIIRDQHHGILQLDIPHSNLSVANILERLEAAKDTYSITHYSVSQTTLDNVFMSFVREQNDGLSPEYDNYSSSSGESDSVATGEPFSNPGYNNFAYSNAGFTGSKLDGLHVQREPAGVFLPKESSIYPDLSTKL